MVKVSKGQDHFYRGSKPPRIPSFGNSSVASVAVSPDAILHGTVGELFVLTLLGTSPVALDSRSNQLFFPNCFIL